ncbi:hypothetical protein [Rhodanobacter sp. BL-MT-08]
MIKRISQPYSFSAVLLPLLVALFALYWPVMRADFAWDELLDSLTSISAHSANPWRTLLIGQTNGFTTYFRPLVMGLFSLELHVFAYQPGPMHAVSLSIHALNVVLVGLLAMRLSAVISRHGSWRVAVLPMLIYAVHPLLIEPLSWIGCQYDLAVTTFTLLALLANVTLQRPWPRIAAISACFFLAACCKESAVSFPLILLAMDWLLIGGVTGTGAMTRLGALIRNNASVYVGVLLTGATYLALRHHYLGYLVQATEGRALGVLGRVQEVSFLLVHYLRMLLWPMTGLNPIHPLDVAQFRTLSLASVATDIAALGLVGAAVVLSLRRQAVGVLLLVVMFSLLPVLHIVPVKFDASLYHERYAMTALALACCLLPLLVAQSAYLLRGLLLIRVAALGTLVLWLFASLANVRATVPLWSSDVMRWQWAYLDYPDSTQAQESLLAAYVDHQDYRAARGMVDELLTHKSPCLICVVHAAQEALATSQPALAGLLLDRLDSSGLPRNRGVAESYLAVRKRIATDQGDSLALRASFGTPAEIHPPMAAYEISQTAADRAIPLSADALLTFARVQHLGHSAATHPLFAASSLQDAGAGFIAL